MRSGNRPNPAAVDDRSGNPNYRNQRAEGDPKLAESPMPLHSASAHQSGLENEEGQPTGKDSCVNLEDPRPRHGRMDKVLVYGETEAVHDHRNDQERHEKIEVFTLRHSP